MQADPRVTVVVRSYQRPRALAELLASLLEQDHDSFEIVVVEQTVEMSDEDAGRLAPLFADPRVRVLRFPPLGGARARNEGVRAARGAIVVLIDDDDLPADRGWIRGHEAHYLSDATLVGLSARQVRTPGETCPYSPALRALVRHVHMRFSPLGVPHIAFNRFDEDIDDVDLVNGTNGSVRRDVALRLGLWDEHMREYDEHSFGLKFRRMKRGAEHFAWKATPTMVRRLDVVGGMNKRAGDLRKELRRQLMFSHRVIAEHHPVRFRAAYPLYLASALVRTMGFVWDPEWFRDPVVARLGRTADLLRMFPRELRDVRKAARAT